MAWIRGRRQFGVGEREKEKKKRKRTKKGGRERERERERGRDFNQDSAACGEGKAISFSVTNHQIRKMHQNTFICLVCRMCVE
jgi:hypothetical protein